MKPLTQSTNRRQFLSASASISIGITAMPFFMQTAWSNPPNQDDDKFIIGPQEGYTPQIGTLVSMLNYKRGGVINIVKEMTVGQLDFLLDEKANTIGALLLHLAATEKYYQLHTFQNMEWGSWDDSIKEKWDTPSNLGEEARNKIKGNNLEFYINNLNEVRNVTLEELKKRDDNWLMTVDKDWSWGSPANNYFKWFHVCEHEAHHIGQISLIKGRLPG